MGHNTHWIVGLLAAVALLVVFFGGWATLLFAALALGGL